MKLVKTIKTKIMKDWKKLLNSDKNVHIDFNGSKSVLDFHNEDWEDLVRLVLGCDRVDRYLVNDYTEDEIINENRDWDCVDRCLDDLGITSQSDDEEQEEMMFELRSDLASRVLDYILEQGSHK